MSQLMKLSVADVDLPWYSSTGSLFSRPGMSDLTLFMTSAWSTLPTRSEQLTKVMFWCAPRCACMVEIWLIGQKSFDKSRLVEETKSWLM